jgi:hypothetical protein
MPFQHIMRNDTDASVLLEEVTGSAGGSGAVQVNLDGGAVEGDGSARDIEERPGVDPT